MFEEHLYFGKIDSIKKIIFLPWVSSMARIEIWAPILNTTITVCVPTPFENPEHTLMCTYGLQSCFGAGRPQSHN